MANLLFSSDNLSSYIFFVDNESLCLISKITDVPVFDIIKDNNLKGEPVKNTALVINKASKTKILYPEDFSDKEYINDLKSYNGVDFLFPFVKIKLP